MVYADCGRLSEGGIVRLYSHGEAVHAEVDPGAVAAVAHQRFACNSALSWVLRAELW